MKKIPCLWNGRLTTAGILVFIPLIHQFSIITSRIHSDFLLEIDSPVLKRKQAQNSLKNRGGKTWKWSWALWGVL